MVMLVSSVILILVSLAVGARMGTEKFREKAGDYEEQLASYRLSYESLSANQGSSRYQFVDRMVHRDATNLPSMLRKLAEKHHLVVMSIEEKGVVTKFSFQGDIKQYLLFWEDWNRVFPLVALKLYSVTGKTPLVKIEGEFFVVFENS